MKKIICLLSLIAFFAIFDEKSFSQNVPYDVIYKTDKTEIKAKVVEIQEDFIKFIKYTAADSSNGPLRNIRISDVFMIIYSNGTRETFSAVKSEEKKTEKIPETTIDSIQNPELKTIPSEEEVIIEAPLSVQEPVKEPIEVTIVNKKSSFEKQKYFQAGFAVKTFTDSELSDYFGEFSGVELEAGVEVIKDLSAGLVTSMHWKKLEEEEKFKYWDLAFLLDYCPADFHVGGGLVMGSLTSEYYDTSQPGFPEWNTYSDYAIGFVLRIGYEVRLSNHLSIYGGVKYTKVTLEDGDEKMEIANFGASLGLKIF